MEPLFRHPWKEKLRVLQNTFHGVIKAMIENKINEY